MEWRIRIDPADAVMRVIGSNIRSSRDVALDLRTTPFSVRGIDPTILVAVVGATGAGMGALLSALGGLAAARHAQHVVLTGNDGSSLELPVELARDSAQLEALLGRVAAMGGGDVTLKDVATADRPPDRPLV